MGEQGKRIKISHGFVMLFELFINLATQQMGSSVLRFSFNNTACGRDGVTMRSATEGPLRSVQPALPFGWIVCQTRRRAAPGAASPVRNGQGAHESAPAAMPCTKRRRARGGTESGGMRRLVIDCLPLV